MFIKKSPKKVLTKLGSTSLKAFPDSSECGTEDTVVHVPEEGNVGEVTKLEALSLSLL